jgi:hypothetical protein
VPEYKTPTTIRLNILGDLEIERDGERLPLPQTAAHYLLAVFAVKESYGDQELVDNLWPGASLTDDRVGVPESVRARLDRAVSDARAALKVTAASRVLKRGSNIIYRVRGSAVTITTDLDDFRRLRQSDRADDWQAALALVRGPVAQSVPTRNRRTDWIKREQDFQRRDIKALLERLDPDTKNAAIIEQRVNDVLGGQWSLLASEMSAPPAASVAAEIAPEATPDVTVPPAPRPRSNRSSKRRWFAKRYMAAGFAATFLLAAGIVASVQLRGGTSIPPEGSVIDADTGKVVAHPKILASPMPAQLEFGSIFRACDLSARSSCGSGHDGPVPLKVKLGDTIAFRITLNDGFSAPIHSLKLEARSQKRVLVVDSQARPKKLETSPTELEINMSAKWPETLGTYEIVDEPGHVHGGAAGTRPPKNTIYFQLPHPGRYGLAYIPGSTTLVNKEAHFFHYLPDGIMHFGLELENVGSPPSCFWCAQRYIRYVYFHTKVTTG